MIKVRLNVKGVVETFKIENQLVEVYNSKGEKIAFTNAEGTETNILKDILNSNSDAKIEMLEIK